MRTRYWVLIALVSLAGIFLLSGCDAGPTCVSSHQEIRYTMGDFSYNFTTGKYDVQPGLHNVTVCDKWETPPTNAS